MEGKVEGMRKKGRPRRSWIGEMRESVGMGQWGAVERQITEGCDEE